MSKAYLRQNIFASLKFYIDGEGFAITEIQPIEIDPDMTVRELMLKATPVSKKYVSGDRPKDSDKKLIYNTYYRNPETKIMLSFGNPIMMEWDIEEN